MTTFDTVVRHIAQGTTYSWDLTVLVGLGLAIPAALRDKLLHGRTTPDEAAYVTSIYAGQQLHRWRG